QARGDAVVAHVLEEVPPGQARQLPRLRLPLEEERRLDLAGLVDRVAAAEERRQEGEVRVLVPAEVGLLAALKVEGVDGALDPVDEPAPGLVIEHAPPPRGRPRAASPGSLPGAARPARGARRSHGIVSRGAWTVGRAGRKAPCLSPVR